MKKLLENIALLSGIKFFDFFIPLLIIPYVIAKIGLESYGIFAVSLTIFNFVLTFNDFGFNTLLSKKIAQKSSVLSDQDILSLCSSIKLIISLCTSFVFLILSLFNHSDYQVVFIFFALGAFFETISPVAYFQGVQKLRLVSLSQFFCRTSSALLVFVLVKNSSDLYLYAFLHNASYIANCLILIFILNKYHSIKLRFMRVPLNEFQKLIHEAWHIYSFRFISGVINPSVSVFLSAVYGSQIVTIYSVSQRVCSAVSRLYEPMNNAIFPHMSSIFLSDYKGFKRQSYIYVLFLSISSIIFSYLLYYFSDEIQQYLIGRVFIQNEKLLYIFSIVILIPSVINMYFTYMLIIINRAEVIKNSLFFSVLMLLIGLIVIYLTNLDAYYVAMVLLISTCILTVGLIISVSSAILIRNKRE